MKELDDDTTVPLTRHIAEVETRIRQLTFSVRFLNATGGVRLRELSEAEKGERTILDQKLAAAKQRLSDLLGPYRARN